MDLREILGEKRGRDAAEFLSVALERIKEYGWKDLRSAKEFFSAFNAPQMNRKNLEQRIITNLFHYRSNYLMACLGIFFLRILFAPFLLFCVLLVTSFCLYSLVIVNKPIVVGEVTIGANGKAVLCGVGSLIFLAMCGALERLLWTLMYCIVLCGFHVVFRPRSVTSKSSKLYDELKLDGFSWFGGENQEEDDPESAMAAINDDGAIQSGMTSASVRKRTTPFIDPNISSINSGKNS